MKYPSAPKQITWIIGLGAGILGIIGHYFHVDILTQYNYELLFVKRKDGKISREGWNILRGEKDKTKVDFFADRSFLAEFMNLTAGGFGFRSLHF